MENSELKQLADQITANLLFLTKEVLTCDEAARYLGVSKSYLYKMTASRQIPHTKPRGKLCFFPREELVKWLLCNRVSTIDEIDDKVQSYCQKGKVEGGRP